MKLGATSSGKGRRDKKDGYGRRKERCVAPRGCPLTLLPRDIWVIIAARVASTSIQDLFNMQATCKVFLDAARSSVVYKAASMAELPIAFGYDEDDRPEDAFLYRCADAGNPAALFRKGMREFFWLGGDVGGIDTLLEAADAGNVDARYLCAIVLLTPGVEHGEDAGRGIELFANVLASGKIDMCSELFGELFENPPIGVMPSDPGKPDVCQSSVCPTRGNLVSVSDLSSVSCVHCRAKFELLFFFNLFTSE